VNLLLPAFLVGGALVGLPILLHLLRKKPTLTVPFPTLRFLGPSVLRESRKHRIRRWIVLALRCLAVLLLALAFARPFFAPPPDIEGTAVVVAVDNSFSLQTGDRWESLKNWALEQTADLGPEDQLGILLMHPSPTWLVPLSDDVTAARSALRDAAPGWSSTRYEPALRLAGEVLAAAPKRERRLVWMADEQRLGWRKPDFDTPLPPGITLVAAPVPATPERQATVTDVRLSAEGDKLVAEAKVTNHGVAATERTATLRVDGQSVQSEPITLEPLQSAQVRFLPVGDAATAHAVEVALDAADDLPADDTAYAAWEPTDGLPVVLPEIAVPTDEADFLAHAIASAHPEREETLKAVPWTSGPWPRDAVVVLRGDGVFGESSLEDFFAAGGQAWMSYDGSPAQREWLARHGITAEPTAATADRRLGTIDLSHPVMEPFTGRSLVTLLDLRFDRGWGFSEEKVIPIVRWVNGSVALGEVRLGAGRLLLAGFDLSRRGGSLVIETAFVPLVHRAFTWLHRAGRTQRAVVVGDTVDLPGIGELTPVSPAGPTVPVDGAWTADRPGIYRHAAGGESRLFSVNLEPEESDLAPWPSPQDLARLESSDPVPVRAQTAALARSSEKAEQQRQTWWWLLCLVAVLLLAETTLSNRTAL
jgi:hypothetical protein